jgi:hypothetical protein
MKSHIVMFGAVAHITDLFMMPVICDVGCCHKSLVYDFYDVTM